MNHPSQNWTVLGARCIAHLEKEYGNLESFVQICEDIQNTLGTGSQEANDKLMERQVAIESEISQTRELREGLRLEIAEQLRVSKEAATIRLIQDRLPKDMSEKISQLREKIEAKVESIHVLTSANKLLLQQTIDIFQRLVLSMTGSGGKSQTYNASGQLRTRLANPNIVVENSPSQQVN